MKTIIQRRLPLDIMYTVINKKYIPLIDGQGTTCDNCGKLIANIATVKDTYGKVSDIGFDCMETFLINNHLLNQHDIDDYKRIKPMLPKILRFGKELLETIERNRKLGVEIDKLIFEKKEHERFKWFWFYYVGPRLKPYNDSKQLKGVDFDLTIETLKNMLPKIQIEVI